MLLQGTGTSCFGVIDARQLHAACLQLLVSIWGLLGFCQAICRMCQGVDYGIDFQGVHIIFLCVPYVVLLPTADSGRAAGGSLTAVLVWITRAVRQSGVMDERLVRRKLLSS
jgi:hypothetical protein